MDIKQVDYLRTVIIEYQEFIFKHMQEEAEDGLILFHRPLIGLAQEKVKELQEQLKAQYKFNRDAPSHLYKQ